MKKAKKRAYKVKKDQVKSKNKKKNPKKKLQKRKCNYSNKIQKLLKNSKK